MKKEFYWKLGVLLDFLHLPLAIAFLTPLAKLWLPEVLCLFITALTVTLQAFFLGCPLNVLTCWLRRKKDPEYVLWVSITVWLYKKYGRWISVPIFCFWLLLALLINF